MLMLPARQFPDSILKQLAYISETWKPYLSGSRALLLRSLDFLREEERPYFPPGQAPLNVMDYHGGEHEYEAFSMDSDWMPNVIMLAKSTLVWLDQLTTQYGYEITRLDQIPDEELDVIAGRGITALWLIGLWERSAASKEIKRRMGNPGAEASAYSLHAYTIAGRLGGQSALHNLKHRCAQRGIRLASDMVPNHTGIDSTWVMQRPDLFLQSDTPPFPAYSYTSNDLSHAPEAAIQIEDHYYDRSDAAVAFRRTDRSTGHTTYIYHGNDGTSMPWNDTAQLDYLNPETREMVIRTILDVARDFPIIRFDAAMTLAKRHIQRLWFPKPGQGGDIPGRSAYGLEQADFDRAIPMEFWREVVDRVAAEVPDTLLLAEAFWMMEGYFVRTLGMHRVYNSAFMNMLKMEKNRKYRDTIRNTLSFDPEILKRFVNFMNNPDEDTAMAQFGDGDKYFGVCTLLVTMPGLPMIGHGQVEGYHEKYGMEYSRAYYDESPNQWLVDGHYRRIFPLAKRRRLFSGVEHFYLYDVISSGGVNENIFAYSNGHGAERALVLYNNSYHAGGGWISQSVPFLKRSPDGSRAPAASPVGEALGLRSKENTYCLMYGFHDKLTYLRPVTDVYRHGLYVELSGYETQVFLDIREVTDTDGVITDLCEHLDGRGIEDLERELQLIRLRELHAAAGKLFSRRTIALIASLLRGDRAAALPLKEVAAEVTRKISDIWGDIRFSEASLLKGSTYSTEDTRQSRFIDTLQAVGAAAEQADTVMTRYLHNCLAIMGEVPAVIAGTLLALPITANDSGEVRYSHELLLDVLLHNRLYEAGLALDQNMRSTIAVELITSNWDWLERRSDVSTGFMQELAATPAFREAAGINWYDGVEWYHRESLQNTFLYLVIAAIGGTGGLPSGNFLKQLEEHLSDWLHRESSADYRIDRFLNG